MPIAPVSPSPLTPIASIERLASSAPVATDGMRPCTELKPCDWLRKYAGLLLEQPMPDSFRTRLASTPRSKHASMMRSEIALCPHPAHSVVLPPRYCDSSRPIRFSFFPGAGADPAGVVIVLLSTNAGRMRRSVQLCGRVGNGQAFLRENRVGHAPRVDRQAVVGQHAADRRWSGRVEFHRNQGSLRFVSVRLITVP